MKKIFALMLIALMICTVQTFASGTSKVQPPGTCVSIDNMQIELPNVFDVAFQSVSSLAINFVTTWAVESLPPGKNVNHAIKEKMPTLIICEIDLLKSNRDISWN